MCDNIRIIASKDKYFVFIEFQNRLYRTIDNYTIKESINIKKKIKELSLKDFANRLDIVINHFVKIVYLDDLKI